MSNLKTQNENSNVKIRAFKRSRERHLNLWNFVILNDSAEPFGLELRVERLIVEALFQDLIPSKIPK